jgi:hypothetical protein
MAKNARNAEASASQYEQNPWGIRHVAPSKWCKSTLSVYTNQNNAIPDQIDQGKPPIQSPNDVQGIVLLGAVATTFPSIPSLQQHR